VPELVPISEIDSGNPSGMARMSETESILSEGDTVWRTATADRLAFLVDGADYFGALRDALGRARQSVLILAWVIDSQLSLVRDEDADGQPAKLVEFLSHLLKVRPNLHIRIACWDHSVIFTFDRELLTRVRLGWTTPERLHFELDNNHPPGAALHEKVVVIDDEVAFIGGFDLGRHRWDTSQHDPEEPRRVSPTGEPYPPFHDVQAVLSGPAARILGDHARRRWQRLTGEFLKPVDAVGDPWPSAVDPVIEDLDIGVARTRAAHDGRPEVRETLNLHLRMIAEAKGHIFIENQYLTSDDIGCALSNRLAEEVPPEVLAITSRETEGWLEQVTMGGLRARWCRELHTADRGEKFRVYCPVTRGGQSVTVHSKVFTVDDRWLYIGSANLANRSMVLDSECGLAIDAGDRDEVRRVIRALRHRLLAEHLGLMPSDVAALEERLSLGATVDALAGGERTLEQLPVGAQQLPDGLEPIAQLADPHDVLSLSQIARELIGSYEDALSD
jgi:phosphatidylserine/phosphatidylglycerophosphate/cardiolipin synthase-like enzyme